MSAPDKLDWNDLRYFLAAARALSLAGAARVLGVEHSTVGRRLRALERALGGSLVLRNPDGLALTPLGERVFAAARRLEEAVAAVQEAASGAQERVRLAVPSGFAKLLAGRLGRLQEAEPAVALDVVSGAAVVDLAKGDADLAVRVGQIADPDLVARPLGRIAWSLYAAPAYLQRRPPNPDPCDLSGHAVIGFAPALSDTPNGRWITDHAAAAHIVMRGRELVDIADAAAQGMGVALLPCFLGNRLPALARLTDPLVGTDVSLVYRREMRQSAAVALAIEVIVEAMTEARSFLAAGESATGVRHSRTT